MASLALENTTAVSSGYSTAVPAVPSHLATFLGLSAESNSTYLQLIFCPQTVFERQKISYQLKGQSKKIWCSLQEEYGDVPVKSAWRTWRLWLQMFLGAERRRVRMCQIDDSHFQTSGSDRGGTADSAEVAGRTGPRDGIQKFRLGELCKKNPIFLKI